MPKRKDISSILIIGAGPIIIGQACEFDYSGAQACKALKEEGFRVILVNSNPATIMTDPLLADATYIEPIHWESVEKIIEKEKPDAILPTMGGQTALNTALTLDKKGVLKKHNVILIGANRTAIDKAEDRQLFDETMQSINLETPASGIAHSMSDALEVQEKIGFPCIIRPSFTMGGTGGGIAYNISEFKSICEKGLELSPTNELLIDESLIGWKEFTFAAFAESMTFDGGFEQGVPDARKDQVTRAYGNAAGTEINYVPTSRPYGHAFTGTTNVAVSSNAAYQQFTNKSYGYLNEDLMQVVTTPVHGIQILAEGQIMYSFNQDIITAGSTGYTYCQVRRHNYNNSSSAILGYHLITNTNGQWDMITGQGIFDVQAGDIISFYFGASNITNMDGGSWSYYNLLWWPVTVTGTITNNGTLVIM